MTRAYITIDTELSSYLFRRDGIAGMDHNFACSITGSSHQGDVGIIHQMDMLDAHGLRAVFFVDPMPALVAGPDIVKRMIDPILARGHDVQLHVHTEWLDFVDTDHSPVSGRTGQHIKHFGADDQYVILEFARDLLVQAGAPAPVAFRAGNYGANDDTLRALARLGIVYDTSFSPGIRYSACDISLPPEQLTPVEHCGVIEVPIAAIGSWGTHRRHVQLTALSAWEMAAAIDHAHASALQSFSLVSHSFELMSRDRTQTNKIVARRFERLCACLADHPGVDTATYSDHPPVISDACGGGGLLPHNPLRTAIRLGEQAIANRLYGEARLTLDALDARQSWPLRKAAMNPVHQMIPLQNIAVDCITAF